MRKFTSMTLAVAAALAVLAGSATAVVRKPITFSGTYAGNATTQTNNGTATITANGTGKGTLIGAGAIHGDGTGDTTQQPCVPFTGTGTMKGPLGVITFRVPAGSNGCGDDGGHTFAITAHFIVTKATGKLKGYTGSLKVTGNWSHDDGTFAVKVFGTLK